MQDYNQMMPLSQMERITRQYLCDNLDAVLDRVVKGNIGLVITDDNGNDDLVLCPAHWITYTAKAKTYRKMSLPQKIRGRLIDLLLTITVISSTAPKIAYSTVTATVFKLSTAY